MRIMAIQFYGRAHIICAKSTTVLSFADSPVVGLARALKANMREQPPLAGAQRKDLF
jgi:hypothetical protein